jgi:uncharacterized protein YllA (UPF0747 family)
MRIERVPLSALPDHFRPLAVAFAGDDPRLRSRFPLSWRDEAALAAHARHVASRGLEPEVVARLDPGPARDKLKSGAAAVVAGQQPSVALGPLYNVYKAISAVRWARRLEAAGVPAVPVFWNHSDDDHAEGLNRIALPDRSGTLRALETPWSSDGALAFREARLDLDLLASLLPEAEGAREALRILRDCERGPVAADFTRLLRALFRDELLVVEPRQLDGPRAQEVFRKALSDPGRVHRLVDEGGERLKSLGFERALGHSLGSNVYAFEGPRRVRVEGTPPTGARLSAGVALRLILQDTVLPAALTVAGPNEAGYLAQLRELYEFFGLPGPIAAPRITATLVDPRAARVAASLEVTGADLLAGEEALRRRAALRSGADVLATVDDLASHGRARLEAIESGADAPLRELARKTREKISSVLAAFRERIVTAAKDADAVAAERARKLAAHFTPEGKLQERVVPVWYFIAVAGPRLLDELKETLDPFAGDHQIVWL